MRTGLAIALAILASTATGCAYHNVIHNASGVFDAAESHRFAGRDSLARVELQRVVERAGTAYRARPDASWAREALVLLGRAHARLGNLRAARSAFEEARGLDGDPRTRDDVHVYLAGIAAELGDREEALERVNAHIQGDLSDPARAEAHLLRGRLLLERDLAVPGWWDLEQAEAIDGRTRVAGALAGLRWGVAHGDEKRSRRAVGLLFSYPEAAVRADSVMTLGARAGERWGPDTGADLLEGAEGARWPGADRGSVALLRAQLLDQAGDTTAARELAARVASGLGEAAADARLLLADWTLTRARTLRELGGVRRLLLPSGSDPAVAERLAAIEELRRHAEIGLDEPLGWFAAAEVARDRLGAPYLARGLMLAYADAAPGDPWAAKALLAALAVSPSPGDRAWLRGRLGDHESSPYVTAARGGGASDILALEEELEARLDALEPR